MFDEIDANQAIERMEELAKNCHIELINILASLNALYESGQKIDQIAFEAKSLVEQFGIDNRVWLEFVAWNNDSTKPYPSDVITKLDELIIVITRELFQIKEVDHDY